MCKENDTKKTTHSSYGNFLGRKKNTLNVHTTYDSIYKLWRQPQNKYILMVALCTPTLWKSHIANINRRFSSVVFVYVRASLSLLGTIRLS